MPSNLPADYQGEGNLIIKGRLALGPVTVRTSAAAAVAAGLACLTLLTFARPAGSAAGCTDQTVTAGIAQAKGCFNQSGTTYTTDLGLELNGFKLQPQAGAVVSINTSTRRVTTSGGKVVVDIPAVFKPDPFAFDLIAPTSGELTLEDVNLTPNAIGGFLPISGETPLKLVEGGEGKLEVTIKLPLILTLKGKDQTAQIDLALKDGQVRLEGVDIELNGGEFGHVFGVEEASFKYEGAEKWEAGATLLFPSITSGEGFVVGFGLENGRIPNITVGLENFNKLIANGVYLQRLVGTLYPDPFGVTAQVGLTAGPSLKVFGKEVSAVRLDGSIGLRATAPPPPAAPKQIGYFSLNGAFKLINIELARAGLTVWFNGLTQFNADVGIGLPQFNTNPNQPIFFGGYIHGWIEGPKFNLDGLIRLRIVGFDLAGARGVISDVGIAGCAKLVFWEVGGGYNFRTQRSEAFPANQCGVGRYRDPAHGAASAAVAQTGSTRLRLAKRESILRIVGDKAVPAFTLQSADGETITHDPKQSPTYFDPDSAVVGSNHSENTAHVLLRHPRKKWTLHDTPDDTTITSVQRAPTVPRPKIKAEVTGRGPVRTLHWELQGKADHRVQFVEALGQERQKHLFTTSKRKGKRKFRPIGQIHGKRALRALVLRGGSPRFAKVVDKYHVPRPPRPEQPKGVKAERLVHDVLVHWKGSKGAKSYLVTLRNSAAGSTELVRHVGRGRRGVRFPSAPAGDAMVAKVFALGREDRRSKPGVDRFKTKGFGGSAQQALRRLLKKARPQPGKVLFRAPCPPDGHCDLKIVVRSGGKVVGRAKVSQLVPDTIDLVAARLKGGAGGGGLTVRASLTQQGKTVSRTGRIAAPAKKGGKGSSR